MTQLHYSAQESANTGLRIARCGRLKSISARDIWSEIETEAYDLVKIKAELSAPDIFSEIERFPCFSMPFNIIALQKKTPEFIPFSAENELVFELYDGTQKEEVKEIISDIQGKDTNLYYDSDIYQALISTDQQQSASMEYYLSMNNSLDASRYLFIGRNLEGVGVGICSFMQTNETDAEGVIYGVRPKFRSRQYAAIFLQQSLNTLAEAGTQNFFTEVQYYNFRSLYPHINQGFKPAGLYVNLNLFPLQRYCLREEQIQNDVVERTLLQTMHAMLKRYLMHDPGEVFIAEQKSVLIENQRGRKASIRLCCTASKMAIFHTVSGNRCSFIKVLLNV
jgi:predicted acetyltransferase